MGVVDTFWPWATARPPSKQSKAQVKTIQLKSSTSLYVFEGEFQNSRVVIWSYLDNSSLMFVFFLVLNNEEKSITRYFFSFTKSISWQNQIFEPFYSCNSPVLWKSDRPDQITFSALSIWVDIMLQFAVQLSMQHAFCLLLIGGVVQKLAQIIVFGCSNQVKFKLSIALFPGEV